MRYDNEEWCKSWNGIDGIPHNLTIFDPSTQKSQKFAV